MQIVINFDSCWLNGFLDEEDGLVINRKGESKPKVREFFATSKSEKSTTRNISKDTVMGVLCRLIGDQRKLYKARMDKNYYFHGCEESVTFEIERKYGPFYEKVIIENKNKKDSRPAQTSFLGVLPDDEPLFSSSFSQNLWNVLDLDIHQLCNYIVNDSVVFEPKGKASLTHILNQISDLTNADKSPPLKTIERLSDEYDFKITKQREKLDSLDTNDKSYSKKYESLTNKLVEAINQKEEELNNENVSHLDKNLKAAANKIESIFPKSKIIKNGVIYPITLYGACLYITAHKLKDKNLENFLSDKNKLSGFAEDNFGFNGIRDFLNPLAGGKKKTVKTPADIKKHAGKLLIYINPPIDTEDLYEKIQNAGVSSFYLGKKGLAYIEDIRDWRI